MFFQEYFKHYIDAIFRRIGVYRLFFSKYGLKNSNFYLLTSKGINLEGKIITLDSSQLYLGPDFLNDKYTLLGTKLGSSPHVDLMDRLTKGDDIIKCEYFERELKGCLDWRSAIKARPNLESFKSHFYDLFNELKNGKYSPVLIYRIGEKYYIYDGKHRAALAYVLRIKVRCLEVCPDIAFAHIWTELFRRIAERKDFSIHNSVYHDYLTQNSKE